MPSRAPATQRKKAANPGNVQFNKIIAELPEKRNN